MPTVNIQLKATADLQAVMRTEQAMTRLKGVTEGFNRVGALVSGITGGALASFAYSVIGAADAIGDLSDQLQLSTDDIQRLQILAGRTGLSFDQFARALSRVGDARMKALGGDKDSSRFFSRYGISNSFLNDQSKTTLDLLTAIGRVLSTSGIGAADQAALLDTLGKGGDRLASALTQIDSLGPVKLIDEASIKALGQAADVLDEFKRQILVAGSPAIAWWGNVLKRTNETPAKPGQVPFLDPFIGSIFAEMFDDGPTSTGAITPAELRAARNRLAPLSSTMGGKGRSKADDALERRAAELEFGLLNSTEKAARLAATIQAVTAAMAGMADGPEKLRMNVARMEMQRELNGLGGGGSLFSGLKAPTFSGANRGMFQSVGAFQAWAGSVNYQKAAVDILQRIERLLDANNQLIRDGGTV